MSSILKLSTLLVGLLLCLATSCQANSIAARAPRVGADPGPGPAPTCQVAPPNAIKANSIWDKMEPDNAKYVATTWRAAALGSLTAGYVGSETYGQLMVTETTANEGGHNPYNVLSFMLKGQYHQYLVHPGTRCKLILQGGRFQDMKFHIVY